MSDTAAQKPPASAADENKPSLAPSRFLHNQELRDEVIKHLRTHWPTGQPNWASITSRLKQRFGSVLKNLPDAVLVQTDGSPSPTSFNPESLDKPNLRLESIILLLSRPALFIRKNDFENTKVEYWQTRLDVARPKIRKGIPAVGRIELKNHDYLAGHGTAWLVRPNVAVTNAHVAAEFATQENGRWVYKTNSSGKKVHSMIDFREEYQEPEEEELDVTGIIHVETKDGAPDIALLEVKPDAERAAGITLAKTVAPNTEIATIGYPKYDSASGNPAALVAIFDGIYDVKRLSPGVVTEVTPTRLKHDCSTLNGNSGSTLFDLATGDAVGLHFGGAYKVSNYAVPAPVIAELLARLGL